MAPEKEIRNLEKYIDEYYKNNDLLYLYKKNAIENICGAFERTHEPRKHNAIFYDEIKFGLMHALTWLYQTPRKKGRKKIKKPLELGMKLIDLGSKYSGAIAAFTLFSRGYTSCKLHNDSLEFEPRLPYILYDGMERIVDNIQEGGGYRAVINNFPNLYDISEKVDFLGFTDGNGNMQISSLTMENLKPIIEIQKGIVNEFNIFPIGWEYKSFNRGNLNQIFIGLEVISFLTTLCFWRRLISRPYLNYDSGEWSEILYRITATNRAIIDEYIRINTLNDKTPFYDPALQPFIPDTEGRLIILPTLISTSNLCRNFIALLNKTDADSYNATTNIFEEDQLNKTEKIIGRYFEVKKKKTFLGYEIDLIFYQGTTIFVCEYKWTYQAAETHEILNKAEELEKKGVNQIEKRIRIINDNKKNFLRELSLQWNENIRIIGVVIINGYSGFGVTHSGPYPLIEERVLLRAVEYYKNIDKLTEFIVTRTYLPSHPEEIRPLYRHYKIGKCKLKAPAFGIRETLYYERLPFLRPLWSE